MAERKEERKKEILTQVSGCDINKEFTHLEKEEKGRYIYSKIDKTIAFTGMMGCGKTTMAKLVAKAMKVKFFDLDYEIEKKCKMKVKDIFKSKGERWFRLIEYETLKAILDKNHGRKIVISLGGGTFIQERNQNILLNRTHLVFLDIDIDTIIRRICHDEKRPLAKSEEEIKELYYKRLPIYQKAHIKVQSVPQERGERFSHARQRILHTIMNDIYFGL